MVTKKTLTAALMAGVVLAATAVNAVNAAATPAEAPQPIQTYLVIDTSPSTRDALTEIRAVAEAAIKSLNHGDRILIVSAHADRPRLRAIATIGSQRTESVDLARVINDVKPAILLDADVAEALQVPLYNIRNKIEPAPGLVVILLTDGKFGNDQADRVLACVHELEAAGARVHCTGVEGASRKILIAAAQGQVRWSRLTECDPAKWLADARKISGTVTAIAAPSRPPPAPAQVLSSAPKGSAAQTPSTEVPTPNGAKKNPPFVPIAPSAPVPPSDAEKGQQPSNTVFSQPISRDTIILWPLTALERSVSPPRSPTASPPSAPEPPTKPTMVAPSPPVLERSALPAPTASASGKSRGEKAEVAATPTAPGPAPSFSPKKPIPAVPGNVASRHSTAPAPLPSDGQSSPKTPPVESHRQSTDTTAGGKSPPGSVLPSPARTTADDHGLPATGSAPVTGRTLARSPGSGRSSLLLYGSLAGLLVSAIFFVAVLAVRRRRSATARPKTHAEDQKKADRRELYAQVNGQEIALGPLVDVRHLDIGSSPRATIPLTGDGLLPRHALLRRDGDVFRLKNLARQFIMANGVRVAPRGRARVILPLDLALTDNVKVALQVRDQKGDEAHEITQKGAQDE